MKIKTYFLLSSLILLIVGCDYYDDRLIINNKTATNIYVAFSKDTVINIGENNTFMIPDYFVKAFTKKNIVEPGSKKAWEFFAEKSLNKQLHIFILTEDTLKKYDASTIIKKRKYERRIDVGVKELEAKKWEVLYE